MRRAAFTADDLRRAIPSPSPQARLWLVDVGPEALTAEATGGLSTDEIAHADRYRHAADRARFALTRSALRRLLAHEWGQAPDALCFTAGPRGKPALAGRPDLHFNVSHSGALALIGISARQPIGVDLELMRDDIDELTLAAAFFCASEHRFLAALAGAARRAAFYRIWTCKEAVLKAKGLGVGAGLADFAVTLRPDGIALEPEPGLAPDALAAVRAWPVDAAEGYAAAVALT